MISFVMPSRNSQQFTNAALLSMFQAVDQLRWRENVQILLLDDASDPAFGILPEFQRFRKESRLPTRIFRFNQQQHYSRVFSAALSWAIGEKVFFLSNDMIFTPDFFKTLVEVSDMNTAIGIVRGTSPFTDSHPEHVVPMPFPIRSLGDAIIFSKYVSLYWRQHFVEDALLSGDAVLINRALIDQIGVADTRYFGYFGDLDYGLRAIRAGFKLVCAKGAWLFHAGSGYIKDEAIRTKASESELIAIRDKIVQAAYTQFREKWDQDLPLNYVESSSMIFPHLKTRQPMDLHKYFAPMSLTPELGSWVE